MDYSDDTQGISSLFLNTLIHIKTVLKMGNRIKKTPISNSKVPRIMIINKRTVKNTNVTPYRYYDYEIIGVYDEKKILVQNVKDI